MFIIRARLAAQGNGRRLSAANAVSSVSKPRPFNPVASIQFLLRKNHSATPNRCLSAVPKAQCIEGTAIYSGRFDTIFATQKSLSDLHRARDGSGMSRRRCRWFSARRRRPKEAPRTGGRGRAACAPAQNHGIRQGEYKRTARRALGVAASIKPSHQVLFFLPITALTILAIATAMPSDCRLCS